MICSGGLANESIFAIALKSSYQLNNENVISMSTHATDWTRMMSSTSPYLFKNVNDTDIKFIETTLKNNPYIMFIRKVDSEFPDEILEKYIYAYHFEGIERKKYLNLIDINYLKFQIKKYSYKVLFISIFGIIFLWSYIFG
jgi:hypothetical protein